MAVASADAQSVMDGVRRAVSLEADREKWFISSPSYPAEVQQRISSFLNYSANEAIPGGLPDTTNCNVANEQVKCFSISRLGALWRGEAYSQSSTDELPQPQGGATQDCSAEERAAVYLQAMQSLQQESVKAMELLTTAITSSSPLTPTSPSAAAAAVIPTHVADATKIAVVQSVWLAFPSEVTPPHCRPPFTSIAMAASSSSQSSKADSQVTSEAYKKCGEVARTLLRSVQLVRGGHSLHELTDACCPVLFSPSLTAQLWAREALLQSIHVGGSTITEPVRYPNRYGCWLAQTGLRMVAGLQYMSGCSTTHAATAASHGDLLKGLGSGLVHVFVILTELEKCGTRLQTSPAVPPVAVQPPFAALQLLMGRVLLSWGYRCTLASSAKDPLQLMMDSMNFSLRVDQLVTPAQCDSVRRALMKCVINSLSDASRQVQSEAKTMGWMKFLWEVAKLLTPPSSKTSSPSASQGCFESVLKPLWKYVKGSLRFPDVVRDVKAFASARQRREMTASLPPNLAASLLHPLQALLGSLSLAVPDALKMALLYDLVAADVPDLMCVILCGLLEERDGIGAVLLQTLFRIDLHAMAANPVSTLTSPSAYQGVWEVYPSIVTQACLRRLSVSTICTLLEAPLVWAERPECGVWLLFSLSTATDAAELTGISLSQRRMLLTLEKLVASLTEAGSVGSAAVGEGPLLWYAVASVLCGEGSPQCLSYRAGLSFLQFLGVSDAIASSAKSSAALWCWRTVTLKQFMAPRPSEDLWMSVSATQGRQWLSLLPHLLRCESDLTPEEVMGCWQVASVLLHTNRLGDSERRKLCELVSDLPAIDGLSPSARDDADEEASSSSPSRSSVDEKTAFLAYKQLYVRLLQNQRHYRCAELVPAILHVVGHMNAEWGGRISVEMAAALQPHLSRLQSSLHSNEMLLRVVTSCAPQWWKAALQVAHQNALKAAQFCESELRRLEKAEEDAVDEAKNRELEEQLLREAPRVATPPPASNGGAPPSVLDVVTIRSGSTSSGSSVDSIREALATRKRMREDLAAAQPLPYRRGVLHESATNPGPALLKPETTASPLLYGTTAALPSSSQLKRAELSTARLMVQEREHHQADHEGLMKKLAATTNLLSSSPLTDITTNRRLCPDGVLPHIPHRFDGPLQKAGYLYTESFIPHVLVEMRFGIVQAVRLLVEQKRKFQDGAANQEEVKAVCTSSQISDPLDPQCIRFTSRITDGVASGRGQCGISEGDVVLVLLPLEAVTTAMAERGGAPDATASGGQRQGNHPNPNPTPPPLPVLWQQLNGFPQVCVVDMAEKRCLTLRTYPTPARKVTLSGSVSSEEAVPIPFLHTLNIAFFRRERSFSVFPIASLRPPLFAIQSLHSVITSPYRQALFTPHTVASEASHLVSQITRHTADYPAVAHHAASLISRLGSLNDGQRRAVMTSMFFFHSSWADSPGLPSFTPTTTAGNRPSLMIVEGPPGTGKTQTMAMLVLCLLHYLPSAKVLLCAPSNCAVDEALLRSYGLLSRHSPSQHFTQQHRLLRVGVRDKVDPAVLSGAHRLFLDDVMQHHRSSSPSSNLRTDVVKREVIHHARLVCSTLGSLSQVEGYLFDYVIVDEASQATEPEVAQALALSKGKCVLIGDSKQLSPTILCPESARQGFDCSLLSRLLMAGYPSLMLTTQYRMHPDIVAFPNQFVYGGKLTTSESVLKRSELVATALGKEARFQFVNVAAGCLHYEGQSLSNRAEAQALVQYMRQLRLRLRLTVDEFASHCGIISFYKAQCSAIRRLLSFDERKSQLTVATVDSYQGKEMSIILISCVRAPWKADASPTSSASLGFLKDVGRVNVALTRARDLCVVFGHQQTLLSSGGAHDGLQTEESSTPSMLREMILSLR